MTEPITNPRDLARAISTARRGGFRYVIRDSWDQYFQVTNAPSGEKVVWTNKEK